MTETKITVQDLVNGSDAISQMRREIAMVVGTIVAHIREDDFAEGPLNGRVFVHHDEYRPFGGNYLGGTWEVKLTSHKITGREVLIEFWAQAPESGVYSRLYVHGAKGHDGKMENVRVKRVHSALQVFVDGMITWIPRLEHRLRWLADAAKYAKGRNLASTE